MTAPSQFHQQQALSVLFALAGRLRQDADEDSDESALLALLDVEAPDAMDVLRRLIRAAAEQDALRDAADTRMRHLTERRDRIKRKRDMLRGTALTAMEALRLAKITEPDFTASVRPGQLRVIVTDPDAVPDEYCRVVREPDLAAIRDDIKEGVVVAGVETSNGAPSLSIRTK